MWILLLWLTDALNANYPPVPEVKPKVEVDENGERTGPPRSLVNTDAKCKQWFREAYQGKQRLKASRILKFVENYCLDQSSNKNKMDKETVCNESSQVITNALDGVSPNAEIKHSELCLKPGELKKQYPVVLKENKADPECVKMYERAYKDGGLYGRMYPLPADVPPLIQKYCEKYMSFSSVTQTLDELCGQMVSKVKLRLQRLPVDVRVAPNLACMSSKELEAAYPERAAELEEIARAKEARLAPMREAVGVFTTRVQSFADGEAAKVCRPVNQAALLAKLREEVNSAFSAFEEMVPSDEALQALVAEEAKKVDEACSAAAKAMKTALVQGVVKTVKQQHAEL